MCTSQMDWVYIINTHTQIVIVVIYPAGVFLCLVIWAENYVTRGGAISINVGRIQMPAVDRTYSSLGVILDDAGREISC